jgi:hypothetical protein
MSKKDDKCYSCIYEDSFCGTFYAVVYNTSGLAIWTSSSSHSRTIIQMEADIACRIFTRDPHATLSQLNVITEI